MRYERQYLKDQWQLLKSRALTTAQTREDVKANIRRRVSYGGGAVARAKKLQMVKKLNSKIGGKKSDQGALRATL